MCEVATTVEELQAEIERLQKKCNMEATILRKRKSEKYAG